MFTDAIVPRAELMKTEFYQDILRPAKLDCGVGVTMQRNGSRHFLITVLFPERTMERESDALDRLQRLAPHLLRVAQINRQLAGLEARALTAEQALDRLATAMAVVDASARVLHMTATAERIIAAGDGLTVIRGMVDAHHPGEGRLLHQLIQQALKATRNIMAAPGGVMRVSRRSGLAPYEVLVAPVSETTITLGFSDPLAALFIRDPEERPVTPLDRLRSLYALTAAEARLMQALLAGETMETIAGRIGVTKETLRSQLKSIFLKTETNSQLELIRLGLRGLAAFRE